MSLFGAEEDTSVIESQMVCAFCDCVNGSDSVGLNDITDVFTNAIVSELVAGGHAVPSGLSTPQPKFSAFTFADNFEFAVPESSERSSVSSGLRSTSRLRLVPSSVPFWEGVALSALS